MGSLPQPSLLECLTGCMAVCVDAFANLLLPRTFFMYIRHISSFLACNRVCRGQARGPLVFLLFPPLYHRIATTTNTTLVITTNLSRINSTSGVNSSAALPCLPRYTQKEKVIARRVLKKRLWENGNLEDTI